MTSTSRDSQMQLGVPSADEELIRRAAEASGQDLSSFVFQHAKRAADHLLAQRNTFTLSDDVRATIGA